MGGASGVIYGLNVFSFISILFVLGSFSVLIIWIRARRYGGGILGKVGITLHILFLLIFVVPGLFFWIAPAFPQVYNFSFPIIRTIQQIGAVPFLPFLLKFGLIIFQLWLGFTIFFENKKNTFQRYMGIIPIVSALLLGFLISLIIAVIIGVIVYFLQSSKEGQPLLARTPVRSKSSADRDIRKPTLEFQPSQPEAEAVPCRSLVLTVQSADLSRLKEQGSAFSSALAGKMVKLQDRLVFQGIPITVSHLEPDELVTISAETKVQMKSTEDQILIFCQECGAVQDKVQKKCAECGTILTIVEL